MTIHAGTPRHAAAQATAAPWFPLDWVTIPRAASAPLRERMALEAPRILNEPVFLQIVALEKETRSGDGVERAGSQNRRAVNPRRNPGVGGENVFPARRLVRRALHLRCSAHKIVFTAVGLRDRLLFSAP